MELKFKKTMAIVVLLGLAFTCYAEGEPEPNKPAIEKKADSSSEPSEVELTTEPVPEGDKSTDQIEAELAREYYKDCVQNLKWALGIIIGLVIIFIGYVSFKGSKEHREALADVKQALRDAREACSEARQASDKAREYEDKAQERLSSIDKDVASKLKEIEEKGKVLVSELIQEAEKQREAGREEAEKQRKIGELFGKYLKAFQSKNFVLANDYCEQALKIEPRNATVLKSLGAVLSEEAKSKHAEDAYKLLAQASEKYEIALKLEPNYYDAWNEWGNCLLEQAMIKPGGEADNLLTQAYEKYKKALAIKPDCYEAWINWGGALSEQAKTKRGEEADKLFNQAYEKYEKSLSIESEYFGTINNWGAALLYQAQNKAGNEKAILLGQAEEKLKKADSLKAGSSAYNLACLYAVLDDEENCEKWLKIGEEVDNLPRRGLAISDADLKSVCGKEWFKKIRWSDDKR